MSDTVSQAYLNITATGKQVRPYTLSSPAEVWGDVLKLLGENAASGVRNAVSKELQAVYSGTYEDDEEVSITPTLKNLTPTLEEFKTLGFDTDLSNVAAPEKGTASTPRAPKEPTNCVHCGVPTSGGKFRPGHDMTLKGQLLRIVDNLDSESGVAGEGPMAQTYTVDEAINYLVSFPWKYTDSSLRERRNKVARNRQEAADNKAKVAAEKAAAKQAKAAEAANAVEPEAEAA